MFRILLFVLAGLIALAAAGLAAAVAFGDSEPPRALAAISGAGQRIGSWAKDQPVPTRLAARDGISLAHFDYPGRPGGGFAVLVHGSAGSAIAMHGLAKTLSDRGVTVWAIDMRGHGGSGRRGDIDRTGRLLDDIADLNDQIDREAPKERRILVGHSSGGGFALKVAASRIACRFDGYLALAPYLGFRAPTVRQGDGGTESGGWAKPFIPRIVGLQILNRFGVHAFDHLPTLAFATGPGMERVLTTTYSYRLMMDFGPDQDWQAMIGRITQPAAVLVAGADELFNAEAFAPTIGALNPKIAVTALPGISHMGIVLDDKAQAATADAALALLARATEHRCGG